MSRLKKTKVLKDKSDNDSTASALTLMIVLAAVAHAFFVSIIRDLSATSPQAATAGSVELGELAIFIGVLPFLIAVHLLLQRRRAVKKVLNLLQVKNEKQ